jgi:hypothetical protein
MPLKERLEETYKEVLIIVVDYFLIDFWSKKMGNEKLDD